MNVLIINDDEDSLKLQRLLLERSKIANGIATAVNGQKGLDYLAELKAKKVVNYPRLILLDIDMPEMNGWQFLERFTNDYLEYFPKTKVIITSYTSNKQDLEKANNYPVVIDCQNSGLTVQYLKELRL